MPLDELLAVLAAYALRGVTHVEFPSGLVLHSPEWGIHYLYEPEATVKATSLLHAL